MNLSQDQASNLIFLLRKFKVFMLSNVMGYADKIECVLTISKHCFSIIRTYNISSSLYTKAQEEVLPTILSMSDEASIDETFSLLLIFIDEISQELHKVSNLSLK